MKKIEVNFPEFGAKLSLTVELHKCENGEYKYTIVPNGQPTASSESPAPCSTTTSDLSPLTSNLSPLTSDISPLTSQLSTSSDVVNAIMQAGDIRDRHLAKQHVMAQMIRDTKITKFDWDSREYHNVTKGGKLCFDNDYYNKSIPYLIFAIELMSNKLNEQRAMYEHADADSFRDDNRYYNKEVALSLFDAYFAALSDMIYSLKEHHCKGRAYKRIPKAWKIDLSVSKKTYKGTFVDEIEKKIFVPFAEMRSVIVDAHSPFCLHDAFKRFADRLLPISWTTPSPKKFKDAYKGYGAYFTMQNLVRFHGCVPEGKTIDQALADLRSMAEKAQSYYLFGAMKQMFIDYNIDVAGKRNEWRKAKYK